MVPAGRTLLVARAFFVGIAILVGSMMLVGSALSSSAPSDRPSPTRSQIADGVVLFRTAPYGDVGLDGNSIVIVSSDGVIRSPSSASDLTGQAGLVELLPLLGLALVMVGLALWLTEDRYQYRFLRVSFQPSGPCVYLDR
jgi:hypothetical protein